MNLTKTFDSSSRVYITDGAINFYGHFCKTGCDSQNSALNGVLLDIMPVSITKNKDGSFKVKTPNMTHAKSTTKSKAKKQARLLQAVDHGWKPNGRKAKHESLAEKLVNRLLA